MKRTYHLLFLGLIIAFLLLLYGIFELLVPADVGKDGRVVAVPDKVQAGSLVSYNIKGCKEGKHSGITSVNIQSTDVPPTITVAVAAPSPQTIHCQNVILVPQPLPTGNYKLLVFVTYDINPVRNALAPIKHQYTSEVIHVTNPNPTYTLPKAKSKTVIIQPSAPAPEKKSTASPQDSHSEPVQPQPPKESTKPEPTSKPQPSLQINNLLNGILGGLL